MMYVISIPELNKTIKKESWERREHGFIPISQMSAAADGWAELVKAGKENGSFSVYDEERKELSCYSMDSFEREMMFEHAAG